MVQFKILSGRRAGQVVLVSSFPAVVGRLDSADVCIEENGVWDRHVTIELENTTGYHARLSEHALGSVNGQEFTRHHLRNGDVLELGAARLQFWVGAAVQSNLRWREHMIWIGLLALVAVQFFLLWHLSQ